MDKIELRKIGTLRQHPLNVKYFGVPTEDPNYIEIRDSIAKEGLQEPVIIKNDGTILSGNLRYAGYMGYLAEVHKDSGNSRNIISESLIPVRVHPDFESEAEEVMYLIRSNLVRRQITPERAALIWNMWKSEYETLPKRKPGRPPAGASKIESPKEIAAQLGITVNKADALVVVKNSPLVPVAIKTKVYNNKLSPNLVAKAVTFAEEEAIREQRKPTQADVLLYIANPPPKKLADTIQGTVSDPTPVKPAIKPVVVKKPEPVVVQPPAPVVEPEPSFEDVLVQVEESHVDPVEIVAAQSDESEPPTTEPNLAADLSTLETDEPSDPTVDEPDESEQLFDAGLEPTDSSDLGSPDPVRVEPPTPGIIGLHTEVPISSLKIDPSAKNSWRKALSEIEPPKTYAGTTGTYAASQEPEPSNIVQLKDAKDKIIARYMMTQAGKEKLSDAIRVAFEKSIDVLVEKSHEHRIAISRSVIEALLGDVTLNPDIKGNLIGLHSSLDTFLKDIGALPSEEIVQPSEQNPYIQGIPTDIKGQLQLCQSFVGDISEVDDPGEVRDLLLDIVQQARVSINNLTQAKRSLELNGLFCQVCFKPQFMTVSGETCENGHGGAPGVTQEIVDQEEAKQKAKGDPLDGLEPTAIDFDVIDVGLETPVQKSDLNEDEMDSFAASLVSSSSPPPAKGDPVVNILEEFSDDLSSLV